MRKSSSISSEKFRIKLKFDQSEFCTFLLHFRLLWAVNNKCRVLQWIFPLANSTEVKVSKWWKHPSVKGQRQTELKVKGWNTGVYHKCIFKMWRFDLHETQELITCLKNQPPLDFHALPEITWQQTLDLTDKTPFVKASGPQFASLGVDYSQQSEGRGCRWEG